MTDFVAVCKAYKAVLDVLEGLSEEDAVTVVKSLRSLLGEDLTYEADISNTLTYPIADANADHISTPPSTSTYSAPVASDPRFIGRSDV